MTKYIKDYTIYKVNDKVKRTESHCPYGKGSVKPNDIGFIKEINPYSKYNSHYIDSANEKDFIIDFSSQEGWTGIEENIELADFNIDTIESHLEDQAEYEMLKSDWEQLELINYYDSNYARWVKGTNTYYRNYHMNHVTQIEILKRDSDKNNENRCPFNKRTLYRL